MSSTSPIQVPERFHDYVFMREIENIMILMSLNIKDFDPGFAKVVDDHFWELVGETE